MIAAVTRIKSKIEIRGILIAALIVRALMFAFIDTSDLTPTPDKADILLEYGVIAKNILSGNGYSYTWVNEAGNNVTLPSAYMPPGQVFIDLAALAIGGKSILTLIILFSVNVLTGVSVVYLMGRIARELTSNASIERWVMIAAALFPLFVVATASFGVLPAVLFINVFILLWLIKMMKGLSRQENVTKHALYAGVGFGLLHLFRGEATIYMFAAAVTLFLYYRRQALMPLAKMALLASVIIAPWVARNYVTLDRFVLVSSNGGLNLWRGNNETCMERQFFEHSTPVWTTDELYRQAMSYLDSGIVFDKMYSETYMNASLTWMKAHPGDASINFLRKTVEFVTVDVVPTDDSNPLYSISYIAFALCLVLGIMRLRKLQHRIHGPAMLYAWAATALIVAMMFFPSPRHQIAAMGMLFPIAVIGIYYRFQKNDS